MIKNLFIPETFGTTRFFSKRIIGIIIQPTDITIAQIFLTRSSVILEKVKTIELAFEQTDQQKQIEIELKNLASQFPKSSTIITSLPDSTIIFKSLQFPFNEPNKISLVLGYELEQFLPFLKNDAISDFIITKKETPPEKTSIMAGTVQKSVIFNHLATFSQAGINPDIITIGSLAAANLYQAYSGQKTACFVIFEMHETQIYYFNQGSLYAIRVIKEGFFQVLNHITKETTFSIQEAYRYSMHNTDQNVPTEFNTAYQKAVLSLLKTVALTIQSCTPANADNQMSTEIFLAGSIAEKIPSLALQLEEIIHTVCSIIHATTVLEKSHIKHEKISVSLGQLSAIGVAVSECLQPHLNLRKDEFAQKNSALLLKQLFVGLFLCITLFGIMISHYTYQVNRLKKEIKESSQEVIAVLKEQFKIAADENDLQDILDLADQAIIKEQETWFAFSYANQSRFLHYLLELTNKIDKKNLGFIPEKITIVEGTLTLKARVKDFEALKLLEKELRSSKLFVAIEPQDTPQFTMKITLAPTNQETS